MLPLGVLLARFPSAGLTYGAKGLYEFDQTEFRVDGDKGVGAAHFGISGYGDAAASIDENRDFGNPGKIDSFGR